MRGSLLGVVRVYHLSTEAPRPSDAQRRRGQDCGPSGRLNRGGGTGGMRTPDSAACLMAPSPSSSSTRFRSRASVSLLRSRRLKSTYTPVAGTAVWVAITAAHDAMSYIHRRTAGTVE